MSSALQTGKSKLSKKTLDLYPSVDTKALETAEAALCPFSVSLPKSIQKEISLICDQFLDYKKETATAPWQDSVLNSLDFHYSSEKLKIIEANTNASGFLLSNLLLDSKDEALKFEKKILSSFHSIFKNSHLNGITIVDKNPEQEKMFIEFLMFQDFFKRNDITAVVKPTSKILNQSGHLNIYNRDTDFYFKDNPLLKSLWLGKKVSLSSSPYSYQNIADKKYDLYNEDLLGQDRFKELKNAMLKSTQLTPETKELIWSKRKTHFFKPSSSFGSKGVYSGKSVSRKKFETFDETYLAQELHLPGKVSLGDDLWKFDIRAFFSEGGVQKIIARVYKGQLTNFSNLGGGFALIRWID